MRRPTQSAPFAQTVFILCFQTKLSAFCAQTMQYVPRATRLKLTRVTGGKMSTLRMCMNVIMKMHAWKDMRLSVHQAMEEICVTHVLNTKGPITSDRQLSTALNASHALKMG
jgi:hypothetical protein